MKRISLLLLLVVLASGSVLAVPFESILEAEHADTIKASMIVGEEDSARLGKYVWMPSNAQQANPANQKNGDGYVEFKVNIPKAGSYTLWGRVFNMAEYSDSFWVTWQPIDSNENPQETGNKAYRWHTAPGQLDHLYGVWTWVQVNSWLIDLTAKARTWTFDKAGETTLRIWAREDGTRLDKIYITNDISKVISYDADDKLGVSIPDPNLRVALEKALGKNEGDAITKEDLAGLSGGLNAAETNISDLTGLQYCRNVTSLTLGINAISDISPLANLTSLTSLTLYQNQN